MASSPPLITDIGEFCQGYFHIDECFEWDQCMYCVAPQQCFRMTVRGAIILKDATGRVKYAQTYANEFRGSTEANLHVEDHVCVDDRLHDMMSSGDVVTLYVTYQPCHHSSGGRKLGHAYHQKSCTEKIIDWYDNVIKPRGLTLRFRCMGIYRAHWEDKDKFRLETDLDIYCPRTAVAREGIQKIVDSGIDMDGMDKAEWKDFLFTLCSKRLLRTITMEQWQTRFRYDEKVCSFLQKFK